MPQNFVSCDREQVLLLRPSLREWLAEEHVAELVLDEVGELKLLRPIHGSNDAIVSGG